jgi:hypothetical protein
MRPEAVTLKRFFAPEWLFIFGIGKSFVSACHLAERERGDTCFCV